MEENNIMDSIDKLVEIVEPGSQNLIVMTGKGSKLRTVFNPPLEYNLSSVGYEMSLLSLETYFSFPNITGNKNNAINITINDKLYEIRIPTGCYDIESINTVLQKQLFSKGGQKEKTEQEPQLEESVHVATVRALFYLLGCKFTLVRLFSGTNL